MGCPYITSVSHSPWSGFSSSITAVNSLDRLDILMGKLWTLGCPLLVSLSAFLSPFWTTRWSDDWMTGHVTLLFSIQLNAPSIGMHTGASMSLYMIQYSYSHFFISALALSPHWTPNYVTSLYATWGRVKLEGKTDKTQKVLVDIDFVWNRTVDSLKTSFHPLLWTSSGLRDS